MWRFAPALVNHAAQVLYQHTLAYFVDLLGVAYPEERSDRGRYLRHQTDAAASAILSRAGAGPLLSRAIGAGLRLVTEASSRTSLVPSPIPGTNASGEQA